MSEVETPVVKESKWAGFSTIILMSVAMLVIGLEAYIPAIQSVLPTWLSTVAGVVLPVLIMVARKFKANEPITVLPKK